MKKVLAFPSFFFLSVVTPLYFEEHDRFMLCDTILLIQDFDYVIPQFERVEPKPLYVCPRCSNHTYSNNMTTDAMFYKTQ
jgi:hypothetical protein